MQPVGTALYLIWLVISASGFFVDNGEHPEGNVGVAEERYADTENSNGLPEDSGGGIVDDGGSQNNGDEVGSENNGRENNGKRLASCVEGIGDAAGYLQNSGRGEDIGSKQGNGYPEGNGKSADANNGEAADIRREQLLDNGEEEEYKESNDGSVEDSGEDAEGDVERLKRNDKDAKKHQKRVVDDEEDAESVATASESNQLLVIILDGFRWDYFDQQPDNLTGLQSIFHDGVRAKWVTSVFPSVSYPCWTTISTGMYTESHGIVNNYMYDVNASRIFSLKDNTTTQHSTWWRNAKPIWTTVTKHGKRVAIILFNRCDVPIDNIVPEFCESFRVARTWQKFERNLYRGLKKLEEGFDLVMVYGEHIDNMGHDYGPTSPELLQGVQEIDTVLLNFKKQLEKKKLNEKVNVVITSDHGMEAGGEGSGMQYVKLEKYLNLEDVHKIIHNGVSVGVHPYAGRKHNVMRSLRKMPGVKVYASEHLPEKLHYKHGTFVPDVVVIADPGICIWGVHSEKQIPHAPHEPYNGLHGRFPGNPDMRTVFYAWGPDFKKNYIHDPIHLVDIYQIFMHLLEVTPEPHNGTWENVGGMLKGAGQTPFPVAGLLLVILPFLVSKIIS